MRADFRRFADDREVEMDDATLKRLHASGWFAYRFLDGTVRFMCSWATTPEAVD